MQTKTKTTRKTMAPPRRLPRARKTGTQDKTQTLYNSMGTAYPLSPTPPPSSTMTPDPTAMVASPVITLADASETPTPIPVPSSVVPSSVVTATSTASVSTQAPNMDTVPPPLPFAGTSTPQGGPSVLVLGDTVGMRWHRVRKACVLQLNTCTCGVTIMDLKIQEGKNVMKCHAPGCETIWVHTELTHGFIRHVWGMISHHGDGPARAVGQELDIVAVHRGSIADT
ncbi:hypothetical protein H4582DRAFT_2053734 [Lactarius indigo]|nr:hypothetical protein H4582DRAFT_2053734 [Lactarius indigo]